MQNDAYIASSMMDVIDEVLQTGQYNGKSQQQLEEEYKHKLEQSQRQIEEIKHQLEETKEELNETQQEYEEELKSKDSIIQKKDEELKELDKKLTQTGYIYTVRFEDGEAYVGETKRNPPTL